MSTGRLAWAHRPSHGGSTALFRVVTELSTILKMSAPPFLCPGAAAFHGGRVSVSTGSACGVRYLGNQAQNWVIHDLGGPGGQEHGVWVRKGSWLCPSCCLTCGKSLTLNLWALAPSFVKRITTLPGQVVGRCNETVSVRLDHKGCLRLSGKLGWVQWLCESWMGETETWVGKVLAAGLITHLVVSEPDLNLVPLSEAWTRARGQS